MMGGTFSPVHLKASLSAYEYPREPSGDCLHGMARASGPNLWSGNRFDVLASAALTGFTREWENPRKERGSCGRNDRSLS